jgi:PII-like signaling protein
MRAPNPGKLLRVHILEQDRFQGEPLYEAVVKKCREMGIAGATVYRGLEGYGETSEIHQRHMFTHDQPIVVTVIDSAENIARLLPVIEQMVDKGMMAISDVEVVRVRKSGRP